VGEGVAPARRRKRREAAEAEVGWSWNYGRSAAARGAWAVYSFLGCSPVPVVMESAFFIFIFFENIFYRNIFSISQFTVLYPYRPAGGRQGACRPAGGRQAPPCCIKGFPSPLPPFASHDIQRVGGREEG